MEDQSAIGRLRAIFNKSVDDQDYEPLGDADEDVRRPILVVPDPAEPFSYVEYSIFLLLGIAMLWAWNMFLAAAPYFQSRFRDNVNILNHFQSAIISVGCVTNLGSMLILNHLQATASYPRRIIYALILNSIVFTLLCISTSLFPNVSSPGYLAFTLIMVFSTSCATGLIQNGAFAFASSFGRGEYIQAIMTGQAVAGVLPAFAQIMSVLAMPVHDKLEDPSLLAESTATETKNSAFIYFLTATGISLFTLFAFLPLVRKHNRIVQLKLITEAASDDGFDGGKRKTVYMWTMYKKLHFMAGTVFVCFAITMFFPVFTQKILSVVPEDRAPRLFQPTTFIPLGFLVWNLGDFGGRLLTIIPVPNITSRPWLMFCLALLRGVHLPLYLLCNIEGKGAKIKSDAFYLIVVQLFFGATNGYLGSLAMSHANDFVAEEEREATGGFMSMNLVAGLTFGSLLSFAASNVS
ncbi:Nucleoside transporter [Lachnellula occidentalis]|uniref:Nucleoside transporter n=1 Tax=Lachnellula occidentalis TaxID=215460 RepID=A0A8H8U2N6_9HELO|nr:Nucleoside transporter [Lachnellula occidentalis]